jgi:flavin-dependent dehydrogenase
MRTYTILGGGPSGLTAAITLARAGLSVEIHERRADCGGRFGGDLQGLENWSEDQDALDEFRAIGLGINFSCHGFRELVQTNGTNVQRLSFERPAYYVVQRGVAETSLDQGLKRQALESGVTIRFGSSLPPERADIVATGPVSRRFFAVAKGVVFRTGAPDFTVGLLGDAFAFKGYAYLIVAGGVGCLCVALFDEFRRLRACFEEARRQLLGMHPLEVCEERPVGGVGHVAAAARPRLGRALCVGEAAGLQDPMLGFGIRTAIASGHLAAKCLIEGREYAKELRRRFDARLRAGIVNRLLWEALRRPRYRPILRVFGKNATRRLRLLYRGTPVHDALFPVARAVMGRRFGWLG